MRGLSDPLAVWPSPGLIRPPTSTTRVVWQPGVAGLTDCLCIAHSLITTRASQTASTSNGRISNLKVVIATVMVWPWLEMRFDCQVRRNFPASSFWVMGYKYPSISCKISLLTIWTTYLTLESPLPLDTSLSWSIVGVLHSSAWFELCDTSDSLSKHHRLVTLGGCRLLDGLKELKLWALQEDCEGGPVFLWEVLCLSHRSGEEQL
jgi:hypothetical protein